MSYLLNTWYLAAWASEVKTGELFHRQVLDERVVLFRKKDGAPVALRDRCLHRFAPLHMGKLVDDIVHCPYHGLQFGSDGRCVHNPHGSIPSGARVRQFPVVERYSALWIWMGDPERADPELVVPLEFMDPENWYVGTGHLLVDANYELLTDNILDLSHVEFLHPLWASTALGTVHVQAEQDGDTVWCKRFVARDSPPEFVRAALLIPPGELVDRWFDVRWNAPATMAVYTAGAVSGEPRESGLAIPEAHIFTPETAATTHHFYAVSFPRALGERGERAAWEAVAMLGYPLEVEDKPLLKGITRNMDDSSFWSLKPLLLHIDAAPILARRILAKKIESEQSADAVT